MNEEEAENQVILDNVKDIRRLMRWYGKNPDTLGGMIPKCGMCLTWMATHVEGRRSGCSTQAKFVCDKPRCQDALLTGSSL